MLKFLYILRAQGFRFYSNTHFLDLDHSYLYFQGLFCSCCSFSVSHFVQYGFISADTWSKLLVLCRKPEKSTELVSEKKPRKILAVAIRTLWEKIFTIAQEEIF